MSSRDYLLYASIIFVWSTSWLPLKWQLGVVDPEVSMLWRFMIAASMCMRCSPGSNYYMAFYHCIRNLHGGGIFSKITPGI